MIFQVLITLCICIGCFAFGAAAHGLPELHHHSDPTPAAVEKLGRVSFPTSCGAESGAEMERGIALLHSFSYAAAQLQFEAIAREDPSCAMAHWGIAMTQLQPLWGYPDKSQLKKGAQEMAMARALRSPPANITAREERYIDALSAFFDTPGIFHKRAAAYELKMDALYREFPRDVEAAAFDALAILASTPPDDSSLTHEHRALAILQPLFVAHPDHPGLAHYLIHTCDTPALAAEGLAAAREYAKIAPSAPHALHMPGHIFARLGMWQEDINSNLASAQASEAAAAQEASGAAHQMHADEFLVYAYLQVGEDENARSLTAKMPAIGRQMAAMPAMDDAMRNIGAFFANELAAIFALETRNWKSAAALKPEPGSHPYESFDTYWAQGIAAGHLHDAALAATALAGLDRNIRAMKGSLMEAYAAGLIQIMRCELLGWQEFARAKPAQAIKVMREAADRQDKTGQAEVDIPAREMLGDLLMLDHQPREALAEYRTVLKLSPNRLNALLSAGAAAEQANLPEEARTFYSAASSQTNAAASSRRSDLLHAVQIAGPRAASRDANQPRQ